MRFLLALVMCLISSSAYSAELLVKAKPHYLDSLTQSEVDKMTDMQKEQYNARSQVGDVIVVRPDGWEWGKEECPPNFVVVKIPEVLERDAKKYEESLTEIIPATGNEPPRIKMLKVRKYAIDKAMVDDCAKEIKGEKEFSKSAFDLKLIIKTK